MKGLVDYRDLIKKRLLGLVEPPATLTKQNARPLAKLAMAMQLFLGVLFLISDLLILGGLSTGLLPFTSVLFLATYIIGRKVSLKISTLGSLVILYSLILMIVVTSPIIEKQALFGLLVWTAWPMILASVLLEYRIAMPVNILFLTVIIILPLIIPQIEFSMVIGSSVFLMGVIGISSIASFSIQTTLRESQKARNKLKSITDASLDAIFLMDEMGRIALSNPASEKMFGYSEEELNSRQLHDLLTPIRFREAQHAGHEAFLKTGTGAAINQIVELTGVRKGGSEFPVELSLAALQVDDNWWAVGSIRDISTRKAWEGQKEEQQKELEIFSSLLRHDLKNDVGVILGNVDIARLLIGESDGELLELLDSTDAVIDRMMNLLRSIGHSASAPETNPTLLLQNIANLAQKAETKLSIVVETSEDAKNLEISSSQLLPMVFDNIFRNAALHAGEHPVVRTEISRSDGFVVITISDNGPGVLDEIRGRLFQRGVSTRGGGLGLFLSKRIVEAMHGTLTLADPVEGEGATFIIRLPIKS